ncbi:uncharacterized protein [Miscanthus floridulus]|uniref:uncharacterized protein n=1 Tax=Miscanthus floridulus TaxID=154761 RepID=UPI003458C1DC
MHSRLAPGRHLFHDVDGGGVVTCAAAVLSSFTGVLAGLTQGDLGLLPLPSSMTRGWMVGAGAGVATSTLGSRGASTTRDRLGPGGTRDVGAASSLLSASAASSKLSESAVGAATRGGELTSSSSVVVPMAAEVDTSSSMVVPTATVVPASAGDGVATLSTGGCVVAVSAPAGGATSRPPCIAYV